MLSVEEWEKTRYKPPTKWHALLILALLVLFFYLMYLYFDKRKKSLFDHKRLTFGTVIGSSRNHFVYDFTYNGRVYQGTTPGGTGPYTVYGHIFPIVYDSVDPTNSKMLIMPNDFKSFNLPFPDSLTKYSR